MVIIRTRAEAHFIRSHVGIGSQLDHLRTRLFIKINGRENKNRNKKMLSYCRDLVARASRLVPVVSPYATYY